METLFEKMIYRQYEEKDVPSILNLWEEDSGWGNLTLEQFNSWFVNTPYGKCIIVVAENSENKIIGQIFYSPSRMIVNGTEIKSLRGAAPIVSKEMRGENIKDPNHPALAMIRAGFEIAHKAGYQLVYTFPAYGWLGLFRVFPRIMPNPSDIASYDCYSISLVDNETFQNCNRYLEVSLQQRFNDEYDSLWDEAVEQLPISCGIVRKAEWLKWVMGGMHVLEVRKSSTKQLLGYAALKKETGLIVDVFARTPANIEAVYQHCIHALHHLNPLRLPLPYKAVKGMITAQNELILQKIGYSKEDFHFAFGSYLLDTTIPFDSVQSNKWYMSLLG